MPNVKVYNLKGAEVGELARSEGCGHRLLEGDDGVAGQRVDGRSDRGGWFRLGGRRCAPPTRSTTETRRTRILGD